MNFVSRFTALTFHFVYQIILITVCVYNMKSISIFMTRNKMFFSTRPLPQDSTGKMEEGRQGLTRVPLPWIKDPIKPPPKCEAGTILEKSASGNSDSRYLSHSLPETGSRGLQRETAFPIPMPRPGLETGRRDGNRQFLPYAQRLRPHNINLSKTNMISRLMETFMYKHKEKKDNPISSSFIVSQSLRKLFLESNRLQRG